MGYPIAIKYIVEIQWN